jgi:N-carbamoylputrescine amidase
VPVAEVAGIGLVQVGTEPLAADANRARTVELARESFTSGADIVVLPEMVVPGYALDPSDLRRVAEPVPGPTTEAWQRVAAEAGGYVAGGICESDVDALYNTAVVVDGGGVVLHYRKLHLFAGEKLAFQPGDVGLPVVATRFGTIGVCICYDLRFVEVLRVLALKGADLVLVPSAWLAGFDAESHDDHGVSTQARNAMLQANLNQCFLACASQSGRHGAHTFLGSSIIADPRGHLVLGPLSADRDEIEVAKIDIGEARRSQVRGELITPRADRRADVYRIAIDGELL